MLLGCRFAAQQGTGTLVVPVLASFSILGATASTSAVLIGLLTPEPRPLIPLTYPLPGNSLTFCTHSPTEGGGGDYAQARLARSRKDFPRPILLPLKEAY